MKTGSKAIAIALLFVGLVLVNYLASSIPVRVDATADSIYSLSPGTKAMLGKLEEPVGLDLYFTKDANGLPIAYKNYAARVEEMLRQYVRASGGKLTLNVINPRADTPEEEKATAAGLTAQAAQGGEPFYFGLVVTQADQQKNIPAFTPAREQFLEYDLSKLIFSVQQADKPKLGLLTSLPLAGSSPQEMQMMMMMQRQPAPPQYIVEEWKQAFDVVQIEPNATELPGNLQVLAVIHPQSLSPKLQFAIDQFLLGGKPVFLAVDPSSQYFKRQAGRQQQMMGGPQPNVSSNLPTLLNAYGIDYNPGKVVGDLANAYTYNSRNGTVRMPQFLKLGKTSLSNKSPATAQLNSTLFLEAGTISAKAGNGLTFTPVIETSDQSGVIESMILQFAQGDDIAKQITPDGKKTVAAIVTGKFKTAFPDGAPKDEKPADDTAKKDDPAKKEEKKDAPKGPEPLKESKANSMLFVIADTDWLFDDFIFDSRYKQIGALVPINDNLSLASNTVEFLSGSQDLLSIRGKGSSIREFTVVKNMELTAQKKYQEKLKTLEDELKALEEKLSKKQGEKSTGTRLIATPEVMKEIENFQKQQAAKRGERREIRRALREDIDRLENNLLGLNLVIPAVVAIGGIVVYFRRRR